MSDTGKQFRCELCGSDGGRATTQEVNQLRDKLAQKERALLEATAEGANIRRPILYVCLTVCLFTLTAFGSYSYSNYMSSKQWELIPANQRQQAVMYRDCIENASRSQYPKEAGETYQKCTEKFSIIYKAASPDAAEVVQ